jgi:hypothetical protein
MSLFAKRANELVASASEKAGTPAAETLVLSITFRNSITPEHPRMFGLLIAAWIALMVCVVTCVIGLLCQALFWLSVDEETMSLSPRWKLLIILPAVFTWGGLGAGMSLFTLFAVMNVET